MRGAGGRVDKLGDGLEVGERLSDDETGGMQEGVDATGKERRQGYQKAPWPHRIDCTRAWLAGLAMARKKMYPSRSKSTSRHDSLP